MSGQVVVGKLLKKVIDELKLDFIENQDILCGEGNIEHMKNQHPNDYKLYGDKIEEIIKDPDYIALHPSKGSIEYIKRYKREKDDYVLVAVRASGKGVLFVKSLYILDDGKVDQYNQKKTLKPYK